MLKFNLNYIMIFFVAYIVILGIIYYVIYRNYYKRNKIEFYEAINLILKFYTTVTISLVIIGFGIYCIIDANDYKEERLDVISHLSLGIIIISASIINFIFYLKNSLKDLDMEIREKNKKQTIKIGQILELMLLVLLVFVPLYRISYLKEIFLDKKMFCYELLKYILISCASIFLLIVLNPCKIKEKVASFFNKK